MSESIQVLAYMLSLNSHNSVEVGIITSIYQMRKPGLKGLAR